MSPDALLVIDWRRRIARPSFLGPADRPWLRALLEERERFVGARQRSLWSRLAEPMPFEAPVHKLKLAVEVLIREGSTRQVAATIPPARARARTFAIAGGRPSPLDRAAALSDAAAELGTSPEGLEEALFADVAGEKPVEPLAITVEELSARANAALARACLSRAVFVRIEAEGRTRPVVRYAKLRGLLATVSAGDGEAATLELSGPLAIFRHTLLYARALGDLLPQLQWCNRFRISATCALRKGELVVEMATGDPIHPASEPAPYDSRLEERFARDFRKATPDWDVIREAEPVAAGGTIVFPDFVLQHRFDATRRWTVEIAGWWTPDYLAKKLDRLRDARIENLILCLDEDRNCAEADFPPHARIVRYRKRIDPAAILHILQAS